MVRARARAWCRPESSHHVGSRWLRVSRLPAKAASGALLLLGMESQMGELEALILGLSTKVDGIDVEIVVAIQDCLEPVHAEQ
eukprot:10757907-Lingulodinium_polyedra.AAC.1